MVVGENAKCLHDNSVSPSATYALFERNLGFLGVNISPTTIAAFLTMSLVGFVAHAQTTDNDQLQSDSLETLEAIGTSHYRTGDVVDEEATLSRVRLGREALVRSPTALAEVIARETGIQYRQSGGFGSYSTVSIRAASAAQTGVYLDGILLNSGGNPVIDLSTLEILNLGGVDVYRGGTPSQLGHGGIGGAINLTTLQLTADSDAKNRIRLEVGSHTQKGVQLSHQSKQGKWDVVAAASRRQSENDFQYLNKNGTPLNPNDDEVQRRENAYAKRSSALFRAGYKHRDDSRTDITLQFSARELGVPEWRNLPDNQSTYDTRTAQLQLSHIIDNVGGWNSRQNAYWHNDKNQFKDPESQIGLGAQDTTNRMHTLGAKSYWEYPGDSGTLGLSMDFRRESLVSDERMTDFADYDADRDKWLLTGQYTWFDSSDKWTLSPSVHWQSNQFYGNRRTGNTTSNDRSSAKEPGAQLGVAYQSDGPISVTANVGSYFRSPSFGELYGSIGLINGNPDLQPEEGLNADVSVVYTQSDYEFSAGAFVSDRDELIVTTFDSRGVGRPINSGKALVLGIELSTQWQLSEQVTLTSNLTWQSPKNLDRTADFYDKFLPGEAQLAWFTRAEYALPRWSVWYELDIQQRKFYDRANILPAADTTQHALGIMWRPQHWRVSLSAHNLGDDTVEDFNGFPKPGRTFSLNLTRDI